jgi:hypothetical protein
MLSTVRKVAPLLWISVVACGGGAAAPPEIYRVRAQVVALEGTGDNERVILSHEAIPNFKGRDGKAETMEPMKMAFGVAPNVARAELVPGSKQEIVFDAVWGREPMIRVTEAKRLPDDAQLELAE